MNEDDQVEELELGEPGSLGRHREPGSPDVVEVVVERDDLGRPARTVTATREVADQWDTRTWNRGSYQ